MLKAEEFSTFLSAIVPACPLCGIQYNRVVGQNVGREQNRRWGNPSAVTITLTHIEKAKWVSHPNCRTISTEKPPFLAAFLIFWSEMGDSNSRHPAPKAGALPTALIPVIYFCGCFVGAPKCGAVPTPLYPDIQFSFIIAQKLCD